MIAACPTCGARYRIDTAKLRPEGARLRCSRCESVFRVRAPAVAQAAAPTAAEAPPQPEPSRAQPQPAARPPAGSAGPSESAFDREKLVLVAHPETEPGKAIADALGSWGLQAILVHDGVEAMLNIQRALPRVVVLDAALPKMFGFQVCEVVKRNESLRDIHVVLVGAIHDQDRYRRPPGELYGADAYIERQNLPEGLAPLLERLGVKRAGGTPAPAPARSPAPAPAAEPRVAPPQPASAPPQKAPPAAPPAAPAAAPAEAASGDPALAAEMEQADRLARIIVSDIVLYNPERFEEGLRSGNVVQALEAELEEGRALFAQRVDPRVGPAEEFLHRELVRVARSRGMD